MFVQNAESWAPSPRLANLDLWAGPCTLFSSHFSVWTLHFNRLSREDSYAWRFRAQEVHSLQITCFYSANFLYSFFVVAFSYKGAAESIYVSVSSTAG